MKKDIPKPFLRFYALEKQMRNPPKAEKKRQERWEEKISFQVGALHSNLRSEKWALRLRDKVILRDLIIIGD